MIFIFHTSKYQQPWEDPARFVMINWGNTVDENMTQTNLPSPTPPFPPPTPQRHMRMFTNINTYGQSSH